MYKYSVYNSQHMPTGRGHRFTPTEDVLAKQISKEYQKKGETKQRSDAIGYATVNQLNKNPAFRRSVITKLRNR